MDILLPVLEALLITTALSVDAFVSGFAYGTKKIIIPFSSVTVINLVCSSILALCLIFGKVIGGFLSANLATAICFVILLALGVSKIFDSAVKSFINKHTGFQKKIRFSAFNLGFILKIYANPEAADRDRSRVLSPAEAAYLAVALSLDGLTVGFGAGITGTNPLLVIVFSLFTDMFGVMLGCFLGNKVAQKISLDLTWLSGALLIVLAIMKVR